MNGMDTPARAAKRQATMNEAAILAREVGKAAHEAGRSMLRAETESERKAAAGDAIRASKSAFIVAAHLVDAGAIIPEWQAQAEKRERQSGFDLSALATLDTHEGRELLHALEIVQILAEKVDYQQGHVLPAHIPTGPNESRGTNYAEDISNLAARLRGDIFGGKGRE